MPSLVTHACPLTVIAWRLGALTVPALWCRYIELGGNRSQAALAEYLAGTAAWPAAEHNCLVQALNECLWDSGHPTLAPYRRLDERRSATSDIEGSAELP